MQNDHNDGVREISLLSRSFFGHLPEITPLGGEGSNRKYFRLFTDKGESFIATYNKDIPENRAFIALSECFSKEHVRVPRVFCHNEDFTAYIQEDLGDSNLLSLIQDGRNPELCERALKDLIRIQTLPGEIWKDKTAFPAFSTRNVMWDLNYFKYDFLKPCDIVFDEWRLEDDFERLSADILNVHPGLTGFMYRDFQSRNIMVKNNELWYIDFQGGREGPVLYDAISFIWQVKAALPMAEKQRLMDYYVRLLNEMTGVAEPEIMDNSERLHLLRTLQVLGAYGFRGIIEKKSHFIESISGGIENLRYLFEKGVLEPYPELKSAAVKVFDWKERNLNNGNERKDSPLQVKIFSFSYKKGYPADFSGNGGGFMFDCRGMHNPGRYEEFKPLTGIDDKVRKFLEDRGEAEVFIERALELTLPSIKRYIERGFTSLQIGFGCTGGRHRSVYCAEEYFRRLRKYFSDIDIRLEHREQGWIRYGV